MNSSSITCVALGLLPVVCACQYESKSCTAIGCWDRFQIAISEEGISYPHLAADLVIDGRAASCLAPMLTASTTCDSGVMVGLRELETCTTEILNPCSGTGIYVEDLVVTGTPKSVIVSLRNGTTIIAQRTFEPHYKDNEPNGPGCPPVCKLAMASWSVP